MLIENRAIFGVVNKIKNGSVAAEIKKLKKIIKSSGKSSIMRTNENRDYLLGKLDTEEVGERIHYKEKRLITLIVGDIYNKKKLIRNLQDGRNFENSEKLIEAAYNLRGDDILSEMNGEYALAIYNSDKKKLVLACDHKANAHLYYYFDSNTIWFSTWLNLFVNKKTAVDKVAVEEFLRYFYLLPARTIYQNVKRLEPGSFLIWENGRVSVNLYRNSKETIITFDNKIFSGEKLIEEFDKILLDSVKSRFKNKRIGIFLSGGIDSAVITAALKKIYPDKTTAYTVGFDDPKLDESSSAAKFAQYLGLPHKILKYEIEDYLYAFNVMSKGFDQPFGDPACLPVLLTFRDASEDIDVMTGGSGGDDLLGANVPRHVAVSYFISKLLSDSIRSEIGKIFKKIPFYKISRYGTLFDFGDPEELFIMWNGWSRKELSKLMGYQISFKNSAFYKLYAQNQKYGPQVLDDALHVYPPEDSRLETAGLYGLAYLIPYHDLNVLEFARKLPKEYRHTKIQAKVLLQLIYKKYFPETLWGIKKRAFNIPLQNILEFQNYALINRYLNKNEINSADLVPSENAIKWVTQYKKGDVSLILKIWALLVLHSWYYNR